MRITLNNNIYNSYTQVKNNKTKNGMTNSVSFGGPEKIERVFLQNGQNIASKAVSNMNKVLVMQNGKHDYNSVAEETSSPIALGPENKSVTKLIKPKYDEKTNKLVYCDLVASSEVFVNSEGKVNGNKTESYTDVEYYKNGNFKSSNLHMEHKSLLGKEGKIIYDETSNKMKFHENGNLSSCEHKLSAETKYGTDYKKINRSEENYDDITCYENGNYKFIGQKQVIESKFDANENLVSKTNKTLKNLKFDNDGTLISYDE